MAALSGATVYLSDCYADEDGALAAIPSRDSGVTTGADGGFTLSLSSAPNSGEGWYALSLLVPGEKGGVAAGANTIVHVTDPSDLSSVKQAALDKLAALRTKYDDEFYSDAQLGTINEAYNVAVTTINAAVNSGDITAAYETAAGVIEPIQTANENNLDVYLEDIRTCLAWLPTLDDLNAGKLYQADMVFLEALFGDNGIYTSRMGTYQKNQIKQSDTSVLSTLEQVYAEIKSGERTLEPLPAYNVAIRFF